MQRRKILVAIAAALAVFLATAANSLAVTAVPAGYTPYTVLANPVDHEVYVANIFGDDLTIIDSTNDTVIATITVGPPVPGGIGAPVALAHNPNTGKLYCVNFWGGNLLTIDLATRAIENTISVGYGHVDPKPVVVNPSTGLVYFASLGNNEVYAVEGDTADPNYNKVIATIPVGLYPRSLAVNTTLGRLYVANTSSGTISVVDVDPLSANFHTVIATVQAGLQPYALAVNHSTGKVYVTNRLSDNVHVIDGATNSRVATVTTGDYPRAVDVNPDRNLVYVANRDSNTISVIDGASDTVTRTVDVGTKPYAVACIRTLTGDTFVANYGSSGTSSTVTTIDASFNTSETTVGIGPASLSIDTLLGKPKVYVGNYESNNVSVIDPPVGASSLVTSIDGLPGDRTSDPTPVITGSSASLATPHPHNILKVYYLLDSTDGRWTEAEIMSGLGTPSVTWRVALIDPLAPGSHTIRAFAMDMTGATVTSSDGFASSTSYTGEIAAYSFAYQESSAGSISGVVFDDANTNGLKDPSETDLAGSPVSLGLPDSTTTETVTDSDGRYIFANLDAGDYVVRHDFGDGWRSTTPTSVALSLGTGEAKTVNFGAIRYGWVHGRVTDEYSGRACSNIAVSLAGTARSTLTDQSGSFSLRSLVPNGTALEPAAHYTVALTLPPSLKTHDEMTKAAVVVEGAGTRVDFEVYRAGWGRGRKPHSRGWWKNWRTHFSGAWMARLLSRVQLASGRYTTLRVDDVRRYLSFGRRTTTRRKAEAELLVAWLNIVNRRLGLDVRIDLRRAKWWRWVVSPGVGPITTVGGLLSGFEDRIETSGMSRRQWAIMKSILHALSRGRLFV